MAIDKFESLGSHFITLRVVPYDRVSSGQGKSGIWNFEKKSQENLGKSLESLGKLTFLSRTHKFK